MSSLENDNVLLDADAADFAFHAGQVLERILLDRGLELARASQASIVTRAQVESCIDDSLLVALKRGLDERAERESQRAV